MPVVSERTFKAARKRTTTAIKTKILSALQKIETAGDFACFDRVSPSVAPGLHINCLGPVKLPLSQADVAAYHRRLPSKPLWSGNTSKWQEKIFSGIMKTVIKELRVYTGRIRAERYKFLLYEPGAFFLPHQDSPKANGMFGTLVVCLPSKHDGGEVVVTHQGKSRILESAATSGSSTSFAAWYIDVTHEIKPVKIGHRMVITYNLIHDGPGDTPSFVPSGSQS
ncbi:hypothetical protein LOZ65_005143 [Ophidiomyces ophidiicola]|nr:hypothetical protein LOZ65_005143 [Ophidiomyces ophidiicola]